MSEDGHADLELRTNTYTITRFPGGLVLVTIWRCFGRFGRFSLDGFLSEAVDWMVPVTAFISDQPGVL